jgi:hypothetical protein
VQARLPVLTAALALALVVPSLGRADGDPASDTLLVQDVYYPYPTPSAGVLAELQSAIAAAYAHGYRLKVAVIATQTDLGAIPSLFGKPTEYAKFLGSELRRFYVGPLLIVMPAGFGIYDGGRATAAEEHVLSTMKVSGGSTDELVQTASAAAQKLLAAGALKSIDITPPYVAAIPSGGSRGKVAQLRYVLGDDSKRASLAISIRARGKILATLRTPLGPVKLGQNYAINWLVPRTLTAKVVTFCLVGTDAVGYRSPQSCSTLKIV